QSKKEAEPEKSRIGRPSKKANATRLRQENDERIDEADVVTNEQYRSRRWNILATEDAGAIEKVGWQPKEDANDGIRPAPHHNAQRQNHEGIDERPQPNLLEQRAEQVVGARG